MIVETTELKTVEQSAKIETPDVLALAFDDLDLVGGGGSVIGNLT